MRASLPAALRPIGIFGLSAHEACHRARRRNTSWALTPRFHPYLSEGGRLLVMGYGDWARLLHTVLNNRP